MPLDDGLPTEATHYNMPDILTGLMYEFGKYTLKYEPPDGSPTDHAIEMTISSNANLTQMLEFFQSFLRGAGYHFEGKELCFEREAPDLTDIPERWEPFDFGFPQPSRQWQGSTVSSTGDNVVAIGNARPKEK